MGLNRIFHLLTATLLLTLFPLALNAQQTQKVEDKAKTSESPLKSTPTTTKPSESSEQTKLKKAKEPPPFPYPIEEEGSTDDSRFLSELVNMLTTLGLMVAVLLVIAWVIKRMTRARLTHINTTSKIKVLEQRSLSTKTQIFLLEIQNECIAIAETPHGAVLLKDFGNEKIVDEKAEDFTE